APRAPALLPAANPAFSPSGRTLHSGKTLRTNSTDPSSDPLSTSTTSNARNVWPRSAFRHRSSHGRPFQFTTTRRTTEPIVPPHGRPEGLHYDGQWYSSRRADLQ